MLLHAGKMKVPVGRVQGTEKPTSLDECLASIIGKCLVSDVVPRKEVDTDLAIDKAAVGESSLSFAQRPFWIAH